MVTNAMRGSFLTDEKTRSEFMHIVKESIR